MGPGWLFIGLLALANAQIIEILEEKLNLSEAEVKKELEYFCPLLPDGLFPFGCVKEYVACTGGKTRLMTCRKPTVYDVFSKRCLLITESHSRKISLCRLDVEVLPQIFAVLSATKEFVARDIPPASRVQREICERLGPGYHQLNCSSYFLACVGGTRHLMKCYGHLKYDRVSGKCLAAANVEACGTRIPRVVHQFLNAVRNPRLLVHPIRTTSTTTTTEPTTTTSEEPTTTTSEEPTTTTSEEPTTTTSEKPTTTALEESSEEESISFVLASFSVEEEKEGTLSPEGISEVTKEVTDASESSATPGATTEPSISFTFDVEEGKTGPEVFTCTSKDDGVYGKECSDVFVVCASDTGIVMRCPPGEVFDTKSGKCAKPGRKCNWKFCVMCSS